jgi:hypothetical protein
MSKSTDSLLPYSRPQWPSNSPIKSSPQKSWNESMVTSITGDSLLGDTNHMNIYQSGSSPTQHELPTSTRRNRYLQQNIRNNNRNSSKKRPKRWKRKVNISRSSILNSKQPLVNEEKFVDPTVIERAKEWFNTKDDTKLVVASSKHFMGEHFNANHLKVQNTFQFEDENDGINEEVKSEEKAKRKIGLFGFNRKKYVREKILKRKVLPTLHVDFLAGVSTVHCRLISTC